jgi:hypothetical protein
MSFSRINHFADHYFHILQRLKKIYILYCTVHMEAKKKQWCEQTWIHKPAPRSSMCGLGNTSLNNSCGSWSYTCACVGPGRGKPDAEKIGPSPAWPNQIPTSLSGRRAAGWAVVQNRVFRLPRPGPAVGPTFSGPGPSFSGWAAHGQV